MDETKASSTEGNRPLAKLSASLGGKATAANMTPEERQERAKKAAEARWNGTLPAATHMGELDIAGHKITCAVLDDGRRVLSQDAFLMAIGRSPKVKGGQSVNYTDGLPNFLAAESLKAFISDELRQTTIPVDFKNLAGRKVIGYNAVLLPMVCDVYVDAKLAGSTTRGQEHIVAACNALRKGIGLVGISALVDEATGFQEVRDKKALQEILDRYLRKEFAAWAKKFPDEFYMQIFRLRDWEWKGMKVNRPQCVARYTKDLIYSRLAPGILEELEKRNPMDENRRRAAKHFQWLTDDIGHPALAQHLHAIIGLMRASDSWDQMMKLVNRSFPKQGSKIEFLQGSLFDE